MGIARRLGATVREVKISFVSVGTRQGKADPAMANPRQARTGEAVMGSEALAAEVTTSLARPFIVVLIGIFASFGFNWFARPWFPMQIAVIADRTSPLIGIAGAFMGLHAGMVLGLTPWPVVLYLAALAGTFVTLWGWHQWM